jgi:hypothetical protein
MAPIKIILKKNELAKIKTLTKKGLEDVRVVKRALILKSRHMGISTEDIVELLDVDSKTVSNTLNNFLEFDFDISIYDAPRTGRPIEINDREKANIVAMVCSNPPDGYARWTIDLIAEESVKRGHVESISKGKIQVVLQEHELKPWREKMWCVPTLDAEYIERMEDVLKVYEKNYDSNIPVICIDEKPVALIGDKHERTPLAPGKIAKKDYEYSRNGSANVFCAVEPLAGNFYNKVTERRTRVDFAKFLNSIEKKYIDAEKIILVMDNLNIHSEKSLIEHYGEERGRWIWSRFEVHHTPKHASWLNQAEIAIGMFSRQCLGDGRVGSIEKLKEMTSHWNKSANRKNKIISWNFSRKKAREKFNYDPSSGKI